MTCIEKSYVTLIYLPFTGNLIFGNAALRIVFPTLEGPAGLKASARGTSPVPDELL